MNVKTYRAAAILYLSLGAIARGATLVVPASEDTALFELFPTSNLGASTLAAGSLNQSAPETQAPARTRSLFRFDVSGVPAGASIISAQVTVTVVNVPPGAGTGSTFELHRALRAWGEGTKGGTTGAAASDGEATWLSAKHSEAEWSESGASGDSDASPTVSSSVDMDARAEYTFPSTAALVADVQSWAADPASNFGWLLKSASEEIRQSARRFASKESATGKPTLTITYDLPAAEITIQQFELRSEGMFLSWTGGAAPYRVERADNILGPWTAVTPPLNETQTAAPTGPSFAFYRVVSGPP